MPNYTVEELRAFEEEIAAMYGRGEIKSPCHLRGDEFFKYEETMIGVFNKIKPQDYWFSYWDSHIPALLKGVPKDELKAAIVKGDSISLCFPKYNFYCSGIVASLMGVAVGTAYGLKGSDRRVYHYCGDMASETGTFYEAVKYSYNSKLPINFIVGDNGISVMTDTCESWGNKYTFDDLEWTGLITRFRYNNKWPHSGLNQRVKF